MGDRPAIGLLFPGQASQFPGMGKELHDAYPAARQVFEEASAALGQDIAALCFRGTEEELRLTENTQPCIFTVSVAAFRVLEREAGIEPLCAAGHSLGEYSALVASGAMPLAEGVRILRNRGRYMQGAVPVGRGAMAALMGLSLEAVETVCRESSAHGVVEPANLNGGDQIVISGSAEGVAAACQAARAAGAKREVLLPVSAPFHCSLMKPAADRLSPELAAISWSALRFPVVANASGSSYPSEREAAGILVRQIVSPVRWEECVRRMRAMGAKAFLEVGPGKVLSGLLRRIDREAPAAAFCAPQELEAVRALAGGFFLL
ncbi:MAG TPA: [acyl-carrier-protein] S-malonyltransferase [Deltaproteobacteria bacterium]|nr:[acyl-carrier-protein] S-malonyltransferase [Deltaproteobacteria bacterium]